jgi:hypothetical protein
MNHPPSQDPADHAQDFARRYAEPLDEYCAVRMEELGIPKERIGADDLGPGLKWCAFDPRGREGGNITGGITVNSGVLNTELLTGRKGGRIWRGARLRDRIDAVIAHEWAESELVNHEAALKAAAKTDLRVTDGAKRILKAMGRSR